MFYKYPFTRFRSWKYKKHEHCQWSLWLASISPKKPSLEMVQMSLAEYEQCRAEEKGGGAHGTGTRPKKTKGGGGCEPAFGGRDRAEHMATFPTPPPQVSTPWEPG